MTCTGDTHHCIQLFQLDKIGKLQGSHADNASYGSFNNRIIRRYVFRFHTSWHQSIMKRLTFFILRVLNVKQTSLIRIGYFKPLGIFRNNLHNRRICQCLMFQIPGGPCLCLFWQAVTVNNNKRPEAHIRFFSCSFLFFSQQR